MAGKSEEQKEDDFFDKVSDMAESIGLKGRDRQKYVHEHMTRRGYRMVPSYVKEEEGEEEEDSFFGTSRSRRGGRSGNNDDNTGGWF